MAGGSVTPEEVPAGLTVCEITPVSIGLIAEYVKTPVVDNEVAVSSVSGIETLSTPVSVGLIDEYVNAPVVDTASAVDNLIGTNSRIASE